MTGDDQVTGIGAAPGPDRVPVADLDRATAATAAGLLRPSCASARWIERLVSGRPPETPPALVAEADGRPGPEAAAGGRPGPGPGPAGGDREAAWSRQEQSGTRDAPPDVQAGLRAGNAAYEERFGHVFLICATGMSAASMLAALRARLSHDPATEREVVRDELTKIVRLR